MLAEHKDVCLSIDGGESVKLEIGAIEFKNYFKQIPVPFEIFPAFECNLKVVERFIHEKHQTHIPCSFP